ncbi:MAG: hypothetical protein HYV40_03810 [Candidatus Levybacteria bacterium]|nr:hypothetical protein [Candidatus Levybacteria bacterium]
MVGRKTIFIIPGFKHHPKQRAYKTIAKILESEGYAPIPITIPWARASIFDGTEHFLKEYKKVNAKRKYILGFSFGAMIAFLASTRVSTKGLILCSLSPYFSEDAGSNILMRRLPSNKKRYYREFAHLLSATLAKKIKTEQILMLYGAKEEKSLIKRVTETFEQISSKDKFLIAIKETDHDIGSRRYLNKIHQIAKVLN